MTNIKFLTPVDLHLALNPLVFNWLLNRASTSSGNDARDATMQLRRQGFMLVPTCCKRSQVSSESVDK